MQVNNSINKHEILIGEVFNTFPDESYLLSVELFRFLSATRRDKLRLLSTGQMKINNSMQLSENNFKLQ